MQKQNSDSKLMNAENMVAQAPTADQPKRTAPTRGLVRLSFAEPPKGAHATKGVQSHAVEIVRKQKMDGVFLVKTDERGHHAILVRKGDQIATHGGCVRPDRAVYYGEVHAQIYGLELKAALADEAVKTLVRTK